MKVQESEELVTELAIGRILYPWGLSEKRRQMYLDYVREHWKCAGSLLIQADSPKRDQATNLEPGMLPWLIETVLADETQNPETLAEKLAELIALAQKFSDTEMVSWLMNYRHFHAEAGVGVVAGENAGADPETNVGTDATASAGAVEAEPRTRARRRRFEL